MLQKMKSVLVVGPKKDFNHLVDVLYQMGTIHLEEVTECLPAECENIRKMHPADHSEISTLIATIEGIVSLIPADQGAKKESDDIYRRTRSLSTPHAIKRAREVIGIVETSIKDHSGRISELEITVSGLNRYEKIIDKIQPLEQQLPILRGFEVTVLLVAKEFKDILDIIRPTLKEITDDQYELISAELDEETIAAITVFSKKYSDDVHHFLYSKNINEVRIPPEFANIPLAQALLMLDRKRREAIREREELTRDLENLSRDWYSELIALKTVLSEREEEIRAYHQFAETEFTVMVRGWIPSKFIKKTRDALSEAFGERVVMVEEKVTAARIDKVPVFYDNPRWIKPFEFFMQLASPPRYSEIDPTPIMAIFFPLFFGIIVGDIGYGILILLFSLVIRFRYAHIPWLHQISGILLISSFPAIFFGYLFGEFFGDFGEMMGWIHPVELFGVTWNRLEAMVPLLIITISIGVVHVVLGLVIGLVNAINSRKRKHICEKCGMIGLIAGLLLVLGVVARFLPEYLTIPAFIVLGVAVLLIIYGGGTLGAIEIMSTVGNILSYARLMAIGMASVILAMIANRLGGTMEVLLIGVLIAVMLHILNLILAMFSPSIHSVRLHVVEFFSKFYEGGGIPYKPFRTRPDKGEK